MFLLFAVLPVFVVEELHGADSQVGLIMGAFAVSALLVRPMTGRLVDQWSRKTILSIGALIYCLSPALYTQAESVPVMLGLRFFHGLGIAAYTTAAGVIVADLAPPSRRGEGMGYYGMSLNLAMTIGPALGVMLIGHIGYDSLFWLCAALGLGSLVLSQLIREPARVPSQHQAGTQPHKWVSRAALFPGFIAVCMTVTFGAVVSFLPLFVKAANLGNPGLYFTVYSIVVVVSRPFAGRLSDRFGRAAVIVPGMVCLTVAMTTLAFSSSLFGLLVAAALQGLGFGGVQPSIMALVVDRSPLYERGAALATLMGGVRCWSGAEQHRLGSGPRIHRFYGDVFVCGRRGSRRCGRSGVGNAHKGQARGLTHSSLSGLPALTPSRRWSLSVSLRQAKGSVRLTATVADLGRKQSPCVRRIFPCVAYSLRSC